MSASTPSQPRTTHGASQGRVSGASHSPILIDDDSSSDERESDVKGKRAKREETSSSSSSDSDDSLPTALELISSSRRRPHSSVSDWLASSPASSSSRAPAQTPTRSARPALARVNSNDKKKARRLAPKAEPSASSSTTRLMTKTEPKSSQTSSGIGVGGREVKSSRDEGPSQVSEREQMGRQKVEPDATPSSSSPSQHPASRPSQPTALVKSEPHRSSLTPPSPAGNGRSRNPFRTPLASSSRAGYEQKPSLGPRGAKMEMDEDDRLARIREWSRQASFAPPSSSSISRGQPGAAAAASRRQGQLVAPPQPQSHSPLPLPPASGAAVALASQPQPQPQPAAAAPWMHAQDAPSSSRPILPFHPSLQSHYDHHHYPLYPVSRPTPPPYSHFGPVGFTPFMSGNNAAEAMPQMPGSFELPHLHNGPSAADLSAAQQHAAAGASTSAINPNLLANGIAPITAIDGAAHSTTPATDVDGIPSGENAAAAAPTAWAAGSVAANVLGGLGNGTVEANPDALKQIFISDEEAISDMANLKPVPLSALDYLKKHGLVTQLKPHQSTALRFLIESEHRSPPQQDKEQKCLFKRVNLHTGAYGYLNIVNGEWTAHEPEMPRGCILADAMGLGKTLSVLALIISPPDGAGFLQDDDTKRRRGAGADSDDSDDDDRGPSPSSYSRRKSNASSSKGKKRAIALPDPDSEDDEAADIAEALATKKLKQSKHLTKKNNGTSGRTGSSGDKKSPIILFSSDEDSDSDAGPSKQRSTEKKPIRKPAQKSNKPDPRDTQATTIVVCPLSVLSNWTDQIEVHCPRLRVGVLYGDEGKKLLAQKDWSRYDVIVTTYDTVKNAYRSIDLLKNHELREADFKERRKEHEDTLRQYRKQERDFIRRGNSGGADMAQTYQTMIEREERALAELDEEIAKARMVCPKSGGKTDWKKEAACLKRLAKLRGEDTSTKKKGKAKASPESDSDWVVDDSDSGASSIAGNGNAGMADYFDPAKFDHFKPSDLLYVWANMRLKQGQTRIFEQDWLRVCLDEAHVVRNKGTLAYSAVFALKAERKVAVTGTPIVNGSGDLGSLAAFIGLYPFSRVPKLFAERIDNPIKKARDGAAQAMNLLKAICKDLVCLRTKDMKVDGKLLVDLPTIEHFRYDIRLKKEDEEFYARAEEALRRMLKIWMQEEQLGAQRLVCILVFLCRMRQLACDRRLVPTTLIEDIEAAAEEEDDEGNTKKTQSQLRAILTAMTANGDDCPVCMEPLPGASSVPIVTPCGHCFHKECLATSLATSPKCPMDRRAVNMSQVLELPETEGEEVEDAGLGDGAKIDALMEIIGNIKAAHPTDKILVFSNFASFLRLIAKRLEVEEIEYGEFYGSHSRRQRDETLRQFRRPLREPDAAEAAAAAAARAAAVEQAKLRDQIRAAAADDDSILAALDRADFDAVPTRNASSSSSGARGSSSRRPPPPRVLLLSIQAGGVGLNLTEASHVVLTDPWWQGAIEAQAIDRAHRIGQEKPVKVYRLVSNATVEDRVVQVAQEKMQLAAEALGGLQYKGAQLFKGKASTKSRIKDIAKLFGLSMSNGASAGGSGSGGSAQVRGPPNRRRS